MNFKPLFIFYISLFVVLISNAQENTDNVLFTIDGEPYYSEEFIRVYNKNIDLIEDESQRDIQSYLDLYIFYKIKLIKAYELRLNENPVFISEYKTIRDQLAERYIADEKITEELIKEAYDRSLKEINADHILFLLKPLAEPSDTLKIYNKAIEVRNKILNGADFNEVAKQYSEDPSVKQNGGALGDFSVFSMVYDFENGAYNTAVGNVSMPVRTQFGYHLIKVNYIRDKPGDISVAHIMLRKPDNYNITKAKEVEAKIHQLYKELKSGANFDELVHKYSQDENTVQLGGVINSSGTTSIMKNSPEFKNVVLSLNEIGEISEPVETSFGWHILKLIEKHPIPTYEKVKTSLENKIKNDNRSKVINKQLLQVIKERYSVDVNKKNKRKLIGLIDKCFYKTPLDTLTNIDKHQEALVTIDKNLTLTAADFIYYFQENKQKYIFIEPLSKAVKFAYDNFLEDNLRLYYINNMEKEFPEFNNIVNEYRDGLLLFDLMKNEVWDKVKADTLGYTTYYEENKYKYTQKPKIEFSKYRFNKEEYAKKVFIKLKKNKYYNIHLNKYDITKTDEVLELDDISIASYDLPFEIGVYGVFENENKYDIIVVNKIRPEIIKPLDEIRQKVVYDYQVKYEEEWKDKLIKEKEIKVDQEVFKLIKKQIHKK